jgi:carbamoyl-phosphate synthase / aspartate carbamoyltransferase
MSFAVPPTDAAGTAHATAAAANSIPAPAANSRVLQRSTPKTPAGPHKPVTAFTGEEKDLTIATLALQDGSYYQGISFGSEKKSISGEMVFQTGESKNSDTKKKFFFCSLT